MSGFVAIFRIALQNCCVRNMTRSAAIIRSGVLVTSRCTGANHSSKMSPRPLPPLLTLTLMAIRWFSVTFTLLKKKDSLHPQAFVTGNTFLVSALAQRKLLRTADFPLRVSAMRASWFSSQPSVAEYSGLFLDRQKPRHGRRRKSSTRCRVCCEPEDFDEGREKNI